MVDWNIFMERNMKFSTNKFIVALAFVISLLGTSCYAKPSGASSSVHSSAAAIVNDMGAGWNLGNTLDAYGATGLASETSWGMPLTTREMIRGLRDSGIKTIRVPVSWTPHINPENYKIDAAWIDRVKQIIEWAIECDMYVVLNIHHDVYRDSVGLTAGNGYYPSYTYEMISYAFVEKVWRQVAAAFKSYDSHLIFETLNEPRMVNDPHEWTYQSSCKTCRKSMEIIMNMNQKAVDVIRKSGGNNKNRLIMVPSYCASPDAALSSDFSLPLDSSNMLALSVHMYVPYDFAMEYPGSVELKETHTRQLKYLMEKLDEKFVKNGTPVVIGEYGATNKNNLDSRVEWFRFFVGTARSYGMSCILWDNSGTGAGTECFGFYNREDYSWYFPEILKTIVECAK